MFVYVKMIWCGNCVVFCVGFHFGFGVVVLFGAGAPKNNVLVVCEVLVPPPTHQSFEGGVVLSCWFLAFVSPLRQPTTVSLAFAPLGGKRWMRVFQ